MKTTVVPVQLEGERQSKGLALLEPLDGENSLQFASSLVKIDEKGHCNMLIMNTTGFTQKLKKGTTVGEVVRSVFKQTVTNKTVVMVGRRMKWARGVGGLGGGGVLVGWVVVVVGMVGWV